MYSFNWTDPTGRAHQFQVHIDVFAAIRVKQATGLSIESLVQPQQSEKWDRVAMFQAALAVVQPSKMQISDDTFALALSDGDVAEQCADAMQKAVIDFLPQRQKSFLASALTRSREMENRRLEAAPEMFRLLMNEEEKRLTEAQSRLSSSTSPGSQASIPAGSESGT